MSTALKDKSMHTHGVHRLLPIANKIAGPLNKRGCMVAGLLTEDKVRGSCLRKDTALHYTTLPGT